MRLYDLDASGNCHKIRLMPGLLSLDYTRQSIRREDTHSDAFAALNPRKQVPVLEDGEDIIWDSMAILVYLARHYASHEWLPMEALPLTRVMQWLAVSENEILYGIARARWALKFGQPLDLPACQQMGRQALAVMEAQLTLQDWLATDRHPTIADIACYPYAALSAEAELPLSDYPGIRTWIGRIQALPGYVGMPGMAVY